MGGIGVHVMDKIIILSEWNGSSWDGANVISVVLGVIMIFCLVMYLLFWLIDKDSWGGLLIVSIACAILLWFPLNDCIQHQGKTF